MTLTPCGATEAQGSDRSKWVDEPGQAYIGMAGKVVPELICQGPGDQPKLGGELGETQNVMKSAGSLGAKHIFARKVVLYDFHD